MRPVYISEFPWEEGAISFFGDPHIGHDPAMTELLAGYSGWDHSAPDLQSGYMLNWSSETFYGLESTGYKRLVLKPIFGGGNGKNIDRIQRIVEAKSE